MDTINISASEYKNLIEENKQLKVELKHLQNKTIERLLKKTEDMKKQHSEGRKYTISNIN